MEQKVVIDGYEFQNQEDAKIANEELAKVNALHSKIDENYRIENVILYLI